MGGRWVVAGGCEWVGVVVGSQANVDRDGPVVMVQVGVHNADAVGERRASEGWWGEA